MYDDWSDIDLSWGETSVLDRLSPSVSRTVAISVVDDLARQISANACSLTNDTEVRWCMQVLCYGLGLPFSSDYVTIRHVVKIYCEWLTCLVDEPNLTVPRPLVEQPAKYARDIINHLHHLFVPRSEVGSDVIVKQAKECHYVLRCLQTVVLRCKREIKDEIWPEVLRFLLSVNDALLSPPYEPDDISDQLCSRTLSVLFELWISACFNGQFPTPSYWKTFRSLCHNWRHRIPLIDQWARACFVLSAVQLKNLYGPNYCKMKLAPDDQKLIPYDADSQLIAQTWFRILHLIGSPAEILNARNFDSSPKFREYLGSRGGGGGDANSIMDPSQHPCLQHLPYCFFRAVSCVNLLVSCFLGEPTDCTFRGPESTSSSTSSTTSGSIANAPESNSSSLYGPGPQLTVPQQQSAAPPAFRQRTNVSRPKDGRSHSVVVGKNVSVAAAVAAHMAASSAPAADAVMITNVLKNSPIKYRMNITYSSNKPTVDSMLRLFGDWLFTCAAVKLAEHKRLMQEDTWSQKSLGSIHSTSDGGNENLSNLGGGTGPMSKSSSHSDGLNRLSSDNLGGVHGLQAGKAEAAAALCKIFCSRTYAERITETHVAKYSAVLLDLLGHDDHVIHASVIFHGVNLFRAGLRGVELLVPYVLDCLDHFVVDNERMRFHPSIVDVELRRACLDILASIIVYPTHFGTSAFSDINRNTEQHTFIGFRSRVLRILLNTIRYEMDTNNIQIALGLLCLFYQSCCIYEQNAGTLQNVNYIKEMLRTILTLLSDYLCGKWSSDYGVCLSALDCLIALSHVDEFDQHNHDIQIFERVIVSVCRFIESQLSRPPPAHSRDMHSTVVAAYNCLEAWIVAFPFVLRGELCSTNITDIIQLGVTGAKPQSKELDATDEKKPASQRVHDAAEQLLHTIFCRAGAQFSIDEPMEDESYLIDCLGLASTDNESNHKSKFLYALLDNTCLFAVIETETINDDGEKVPTAAVVLRSPYAAVSSWIFRLETHSRTKTVSTKSAIDRPRGIDITPPKYQTPACIPPDVDRFGKCKVDASFPPLKSSPEAERIKMYIDDVNKQQKWIDWKKDPKYSKLDAKPPTRDAVVHTARLLLQDLGYMDYDSVESKFRVLRSIGDDGRMNAEFGDDLKLMDRCPARFIHTAHIFYAETGKTNVNDILTNGTHLEKTSTNFRRFLSTLGVAIDVGKDRVWTGHWRTAYTENTETANEEDHTIDGVSHALYWASPLSEIAFVMPSTVSHKATQSPVAGGEKPVCTPPQHPSIARLCMDDIPSASYLYRDSPVSPTMPAAPIGSIGSLPSSMMDLTHPKRHSTDSVAPRWRAQSMDELLVEVRETEDDDEHDDGSAAQSPLNSAASSAVAPVLDSSTLNAMALSPHGSPLGSPAFRRRPGGRLRTLFFGGAGGGRRRQSVSGVTGLSAAAASATSLDPSHAAGIMAQLDLPSPGGPPGRPPPPLPPVAGQQARSKSVSSHELETPASMMMRNVGGATSLTSTTKMRRVQAYQDYRFLIVWLEKFEDYVNVPTDELAALADSGEYGNLQPFSDVQRYVMFICPYENGLYRVKLSAHYSKLGYPSPLVDGMVVNEDVLSSAIRQTILSVGARRRLEQEGYIPPFVKRRQKLHELANKYSLNATPAETFYAILMR